MAKRPVFIADTKSREYVKSEHIEFEWFAGFAVAQKQKSIESLHKNFLRKHPSLKVLEISSKSSSDLGKALSAFNLTIKTKNNKQFSVETAFQASKVFERGGPYRDLYEKSSKEAKKDLRIKSSGQLLYFQYFNRRWELEPKTLFYDWLYINALSLHKDLNEKIVEFDAFTDIEFNPEKSINCQAKSVAIYVSLYRSGLLGEALSSTERFKEIVGQLPLEIQPDVHLETELEAKLLPQQLVQQEIQLEIKLGVQSEIALEARQEISSVASCESSIRNKVSRARSRARDRIRKKVRDKRRRVRNRRKSRISIVSQINSRS